MRLLSMILLMFNIHSALANELLLRPLPAGGWSITQGAVTDMAPNIVSQPQPAGKALVIQIMPAGYGTCEGTGLVAWVDFRQSIFPSVPSQEVENIRLR